MLPVYFDFDGTLVDTMPGLHASVNYLRNVYGLAPVDVPTVQTWIGGGLDALLSGALPDVKINVSERDLFLNHYTGEPLLSSRPYEGINDLLQKLGSTRTAIVTNKHERSVGKLLHRLDWHNRFGAVVCPANGLRKPNPEFMAEAARTLGVTPGQGVMIGDSEFDVEAAKSAGLVSVAVSWGFRDAELLLESEPDYLVHDVAELDALLVGLVRT